MDGRTARVASISSMFVLYVACVYVITAAPLSGDLSSTKRKLVEQNVDKKTVDVENIRRLLNQRLQRTEEGVKRSAKPSYRGPSSFDDEDPLHILLNGAQQPIYHRRDKTTHINRNVADVKRINAAAAAVKDQRTKRFMEAIGLGSYSMGSSSSSNDWFIGSDPYGSSSSSSYGYNDDDSDEDYDYGSTD